MPSFSLMSDVELISWMMNFVTVATVDLAKYGVTVAKVINI